MLNFVTHIYLVIKSEKGETKFDSALQIVISFVIGAIILSALASVFNTTIRGWLADTAQNWFSNNGISMPTVPPSG